VASPTSAAARCSDCGRGLAFEEWTHGNQRCSICRASDPAATRTGAQPGENLGGIPAAPRGYRAYQALVDEVPEELIDELAAALEEEAAARRSSPRGDAADSLFASLASDIGIGTTGGQLQWTSWGFVAGFAVNVGLMKYAQMATGVPMSAVMMPMFAGGLVAGVTCAVIGWGLSRLRER